MTDAKYYLTGNLIQLFGSLFVLPLMLANLSASEYGAYILYVATAGFASIFFNFTLYQNITAYYLTWEEENLLDKKINTLLIVVSVIGLASGVLLYVSAPMWFPLVNGNYLPGIALQIAILSFFTSAQATLLMLYRMAGQAKTYFYTLVISVAVDVGFKSYYLMTTEAVDVSHLLFINMMSLSLYTLLAIVIVFRKRSSGIDISRVFLKQLFDYAMPLFTTNLLGRFVSYIDKPIISHFFGLEMLGIYAYAQRIFSAISGFRTSMKTIWVPYVVKNHENTAMVKKYNYYFLYALGVLGLFAYLASYPFTLYFAKDSSFIYALELLPLFLVLNMVWVWYFVAAIAVPIKKDSSHLPKIQLKSSLIYLLILPLLCALFELNGVILASIIWVSVTTYLTNKAYGTYGFIYWPVKEGLLFIFISLLLLLVDSFLIDYMRSFFLNI